MAHILHQVRIRVLKVKLMVCENAYSLYKKEMLSIEPFPFQNSSITYPNMWKPLKTVIYEILQVFQCTLINCRTPRQQCIPFILQYLILQIVGIKSSRKHRWRSKCHSRVFYSILRAEIDRILLDRHKQQLQCVIAEYARRRLDQFDAIAGVGSHVLTTPLS